MYPREEGPARAVLKPHDSSHVPSRVGLNRQDARVAKTARRVEPPRRQGLSGLVAAAGLAPRPEAASCRWRRRIL
jgi:hypothetical protein